MSIAACVTVLFACLVLWEARSGVRYSEPGDKDGSKVPRECWKMDLGPL